MKKLVVAGLMVATGLSIANAGQITVANTDLTLYGGVSAGYNAQNNDLPMNTPGDSFNVNTFAVGLTKPAKNAGEVGFNAIFASFEVPTVVASSKAVNDVGIFGYGKTTDFKPALAYVTYMPVANLSIDAGLLWQNFGEKPVTILNPNISRGVLFTSQPIVLEGARASYDAGIVKVYAGAGKTDKVLGLTPAKSYVEAGITGKVNAGLPIELGLHTYNESGGRDIYVATAGADLGIVKAGLDIEYIKADDKIKAQNDNAYGIALNLEAKPMSNVSLPVRLEYANAKQSGLFIGNGYVWTATITPTYNPTKNTFIRAEVSYAKSSGNTPWFTNDNGESKTSRTTGAIELGFLY